MCFVIIIDQLFWFLLFYSYNSAVDLTLDCKLGTFYHKSTYCTVSISCIAANVFSINLFTYLLTYLLKPHSLNINQWAAELADSCGLTVRWPLIAVTWCSLRPFIGQTARRYWTRAYNRLTHCVCVCHRQTDGQTDNRSRLTGICSLSLVLQCCCPLLRRTV